MKPTNTQFKLIQKAGLNPFEYFVLKHIPGEMILIHKSSKISKWIFI